MEALTIAHAREFGHLGKPESILRAEEYFYRPNLRNDMRKFVRECIACQQCKATPGLQQPWRELPAVNKPLERISIDITEMVNDSKGYKYVLTVIDHYSRYVKFLKLRTRTAEEVVRNLESYMGDFAIPEVILADNAREFHVVAVRELCGSHGVKLVHSTPYHPQGNSISERMHRTMKTVLSVLCKGQPMRWPEYLTRCQTVLNSAVYETMGEQPYFLMFSRHPPRNTGVNLPHVSDDPDVQAAHEVVKQTNREMAQKWRDKANRGRRSQKVEKDQLAWVKKETAASVVHRKLSPKWLGPYKVKEVLKDGSAYELENPWNGTQVQREANKVKPCYGIDTIIMEPVELMFPPEDDDEVEIEPRPVRVRRPFRRYIEEA